MKTSFKLVITALILSFSSIACSQQRIATDQFDITEFNSVKSSVVGNIVIRQAQNTGVTAEGREDILDALEVKIENGTLFLNMSDIRLKGINKNTKNITISITTPNLNYIDSEGVGNIVIEGTFNTPELAIISSGVGNITADNLNAEFIKVVSEGVGNINLGGTANDVYITSKGVGNVKAERVKAKSVSVTSEGIGNVYCHATEYLNASSNGIGNITYYGKPMETYLSKDGVGKIRSAD